MLLHYRLFYFWVHVSTIIHMHIGICMSLWVCMCISVASLYVNAYEVSVSVRLNLSIGSVGGWLVWKVHMKAYLLLMIFWPMAYKHWNMDTRSVWTKKGNMVKNKPRFGHIPWEYLGQPMNFLADLRIYIDVYMYMYICVCIALSKGLLNKLRKSTDFDG